MQTDTLCDYSDFVELEKISTQSDGRYSKSQDSRTGLTCISKYYKAIDKSSIKRLVNDIQITTKITHKAFSPIVGFAISPQNGMFIAREFPTLGTLNDAIAVREPKLEDPTNKMKIIYGIASALFYLHSHKIILTNLSASTIWLDENCEPVIGDLSYASIEGKDLMANFEFDEKAFAYYSPECLMPDATKVTTQTDIFNYGMILYHLLSGEPPSALISRDNLYQERLYGGRPEFPSNFPPMFEELINSCWESESGQRATASDIIEALATPDLIIDGTNIDKFNQYTKKVAFTKEDDIIEDLTRERANMINLLDMTKSTFSEATEEYAQHLTELSEEIERLKNENNHEYEDHEAQTEQKEEQKTNPLLIPLIISSSIAAVSLIALIFRRRR